MQQLATDWLKPRLGSEWVCSTLGPDTIFQKDKFRLIVSMPTPESLEVTFEPTGAHVDIQNDPGAGLQARMWHTSRTHGHYEHYTDIGSVLDRYLRMLFE